MNKHVITLLAIGFFCLLAYIVSHVDIFPKRPTDHVPPVSGIQKPIDVNPENQQKAKAVAEQFIRSYISYDAKDPLKYVTAIQPYVTKEFYEMEAKQPHPIDAGISSRQIKELKSFPVDDKTTKDVIWNVVTVEVTTLATKKTIQEEKWYWITLTQTQQGTWKVKECR
jgi:hypothetical protein